MSHTDFWQKECELADLRQRVAELEAALRRVEFGNASTQHKCVACAGWDIRVAGGWRETLRLLRAALRAAVVLMREHGGYCEEHDVNGVYCCEPAGPCR